jgi:hypothetical protein
MPGLGIFAICCVGTLVSSRAPISKPVWTKVYEANGRGSWLTSVWAENEAEWFAGGKGFIVTSKNGSIETTPFPGKVILDLGPKDAPSPFAVGSDQFVARLDGTRWVREHEGRTSIQNRSRGQYSDDLFATGYLEDGPTARLVAFGPYAILTRGSDGTWDAPAESDRGRLRDLALLGPKLSAPADCAGPGWLWLGRKVGWLTCHDSRAFLLDGDKTEPLGRLPSGCRFRVSASVLSRGSLYVSCGPGGLFKSTAGGWQTVPAPKGVRSIAVTDRCMFLATMRAVWRKCDADDTPAT